VKRNQKEQFQQMKAQPKSMKKPSGKALMEKQPSKKWSGWRDFIEKYCAL